MKKYKNKIITSVIIAAVLVFVYWWGGDAPGLRGWELNTGNDIEQTAYTSDETPAPTALPTQMPTAATEVTASPAPTAMPTETPINTAIKAAAEEYLPQNADNMPVTSVEKNETANRRAQNALVGVANGSKEYSEKNGMQLDAETGKDKYMTDPVPDGKPIPIEPQNVVITDKKLSCTLSVRCDTILENTAWLDTEKIELVPRDGVVFAEQTVTFYEGESVFNLLTREMKRNKIHMEFENTPIYNSAYIEGINNLYEFDCGELSGWMYKVNGWFPNYGCSRYQLKAGDRVEWVYTCDLGADVGGHYSATGK